MASAFSQILPLFLLLLTLLPACTIESNSTRQGSIGAPPQIAHATIENHQLIVKGTSLQGVTSISIEGIDQTFQISSQTDSEIQAIVTETLRLVAGESYQVVVKNAVAQSVAPITLILDSLGARDGQVLKFNATTQEWEPGDLDGLTFKGSWDASINNPELENGGAGTNPHPGDYYIVNVAGSTYLDGVESWAKGDWVVYRSDGTWTKIINSGGVTSFKGRTGAITPQGGDYKLSELGDVNLSGRTTNSVLKWDGSQWVMGSDNTMGSTGVITGTDSSGGDVIFHSGTSSSSTEEMRLTSSGLGIGTPTPNSRLTVEGDMTLDQLNSSPTGTAGYGSIYAKTDGKLYFRDGVGTEFDLTSTSDPTKLPLSGGTLTGSLNMNGNNILGAGHITLSPGTTINLGTYDNAAETALVSLPLTSADKGKTWFNTTTNEIRYWDGTTAKTLGVAGAGLQSLAGQSGNTQLLETGSTGTAPNWVSDSDTHTLHIPMASGAGVTGGLLSKTDYDAFSGKVNRSGDTMSGNLDMNSNTITNLGAPNSLTGSGALNFASGGVGTDVTLTPSTGGSVVLEGGLVIPDAGTPSAGKVLMATDGTGLAMWQTPTASAPPTSGTSLLKGNGSGGFASAVSGTDYLPATGGTSITTLGTIATGTWNASTIGIGFGGTGATTQAGAANAILPSQTSESGKFLTTNGTNVSWSTIPTETDPQVNTLTQDKWCKANASNQIDCTSDAPSSGAFTAGSGVAYYTGGNVGVGTSTPGDPLSVINSESGVQSATTASFFAPNTTGSQQVQLHFGVAGQAGKSGTLQYMGLSDTSNSYIDLRNMGDSTGLVIKKGGNVGIGTATPKVSLEVAGVVKFGSTTTCNSDSEGSIRYNSNFKVFEGCNGTVWGRLDGIGVFPQMTANNLPSGFLVAYSCADSPHPGYKAFDRDSSTMWSAGGSCGSVTTGYITLDIGISSRFAGYSIQARGDVPSTAPKSWTLKGSNDNTNWETLDSQSNFTNWANTGNLSTGNVNNFNLIYSSLYRYYKLDITANNGHGTEMDIVEVLMW